MKNMAAKEVFGPDEPEYIRQDMDQMFKDYNKAIKCGGNFIGYGLDELEGTLNKGLMADPELLKMIESLKPKHKEDVKVLMKNLHGIIENHEELPIKERGSEDSSGLL